jgi:L-2,4-diaminobutyrate decarboxylase
VEDDLSRFERVAEDAIRTVVRHLRAELEDRTPASGYAPLGEIADTLDLKRWIGEGGMREADFTAFLQRYLAHSVQLHSPRHIAHQVSVPDYPAAIAALVNGFTNNPMAIYEMGPAAATIEFAVVNWMLEKVGWTPQPVRPRPGSRHSAGVLTHGGSLANLTALLAARARAAPDAWERGAPADLAVLTAPGSHYSVARAVAILGMGSNAIYTLPANRFGVIDPDGLEQAVTDVHASGRRCMALVANACQTATGLHDPLRPIGEFCAANDIWLHVDACHGATALLAARSRQLLDGIELADSLVWDAHKMMQVPVICAAVLFRRSECFDEAFHQDASYLAYGKDADSYDSLPRAIECTKSGLGFKIFMNLAWRGERALGDYVDDRYAAARRFHDIIAERPGFECPYRPESNILCFRYGDDDDLMEAIRERMMRDGAFHITSAIIGGRRHLRLTVMNKRTDEATIRRLLTTIEDYAARLRDASQPEPAGGAEAARPPGGSSPRAHQNDHRRPR